MAGSGKKKGAPISERDRALWKRVTRTITPMARNPAPSREAFSSALAGEDSRSGRQTPSSEGPPAPGGSKIPGAAAENIIPESGFRIGERAPGPAPGAPVSGEADIAGRGGLGLDRRTHARMRQGRLPIEGRIDLHGMTRHEAHQRLVRFVTEAYHADRRVLLVITGKGSATPGPRDPLEQPAGVLRQMLPRWLQTPPLAGIVLDWCLARPRHGGEGAFYVYLRRRR